MNDKRQHIVENTWSGTNRYTKSVRWQMIKRGMLKTSSDKYHAKILIKIKENKWFIYLLKFSITSTLKMSRIAIQNKNVSIEIQKLDLYSFYVVKEMLFISLIIYYVYVYNIYYNWFCHFCIFDQFAF